MINPNNMSAQGRRLYPQSLLGEMVLGVLASMAIGTGFSILAGAFVLVLAGGRVEAVSPDTPPPPSAWAQASPSAASAMRLSTTRHD